MSESWNDRDLVCVPLLSDPDCKQPTAGSRHSTCSSTMQRLIELIQAKPNSNKRYIYKSLFYGQIMALCFGASSIFAALLAEEGINFPIYQNLYYYILLSAVFGPILWCTRKFKKAHARYYMPLERDMNPRRTCARKCLLYFIAVMLDFHSYWATLAAYKYTNITSIHLLDCISIPITMLLSYFWFKCSYKWTHYCGTCICILGAILMCGADFLTIQHSSINTNITVIVNPIDIQAHHRNIIIGDALAIIGAILYGLSSVFQEYLVQFYGPTEYLAYLGIMVTPVGIVYCFILEYSKIKDLWFNKTVNQCIIQLYMGIYAFLMFAMDTLVAHVIVGLSAVVVNLSLFSSDLYALFAGIWIFNYHFHTLYFMSFFFIIIGVAMYSIKKPTDNRDIMRSF